MQINWHNYFAHDWFYFEETWNTTHRTNLISCKLIEINVLYASFLVSVWNGNFFLSHSLNVRWFLQLIFSVHVCVRAHIKFSRVIIQNNNNINWKKTKSLLWLTRLVVRESSRYQKIDICDVSDAQLHISLSLSFGWQSLTNFFFYFLWLNKTKSKSSPIGLVSRQVYKEKVKVNTWPKMIR